MRRCTGRNRLDGTALSERDRSYLRPPRRERGVLWWGRYDEARRYREGDPMRCELGWRRGRGGGRREALMESVCDGHKVRDIDRRRRWRGRLVHRLRRGSRRAGDRNAAAVYAAERIRERGARAVHRVGGRGGRRLGDLRAVMHAAQAHVGLTGRAAVRYGAVVIVRDSTVVVRTAVRDAVGDVE